MNKAYSALLIIGVLLVPFGAFVIFSIESPNENSEIKTLLDAFWWSTVTITTVGYGDIVPVTDSGRIFAIFYIFSGITIAGVFLSLLATRFYKKRFESEEEKITHGQQMILDKMNELEKNQIKIHEKLDDLVKSKEN
ncbi:MAG: two pore domain potassium channel family protein [Thaumarchaeota archaeon]|nr:two pore domain potassium channel family protein [Nitrososphaerota archaeon]